MVKFLDVFGVQFLISAGETTSIIWALRRGKNFDW